METYWFFCRAHKSADDFDFWFFMQGHITTPNSVASENQPYAESMFKPNPLQQLSPD